MTTLKQKSQLKAKKAMKQHIEEVSKLDEGRFFQFGFDPKRTITTWELARCQSLMMVLQSANTPVPTSAVREIEPGVRKHFVLTDVTEAYLKYQEDLKNAPKIEETAEDTQLKIVYPDAE